MLHSNRPAGVHEAAGCRHIHFQGKTVHRHRAHVQEPAPCRTFPYAVHPCKQPDGAHPKASCALCLNQEFRTNMPRCPNTSNITHCRTRLHLGQSYSLEPSRTFLPCPGKGSCRERPVPPRPGPKGCDLATEGPLTLAGTMSIRPAAHVTQPNSSGWASLMAAMSSWTSGEVSPGGVSSLAGSPPSTRAWASCCTDSAREGTW